MSLLRILSLQYWLKVTRWHEWFEITFLPLLSTTYFLILITEAPYLSSLWQASLIICFGLLCASFAFVLNTLCDSDQDLRVGKNYITSHWSKTAVILLLCILSILCFVILMLYTADLHLARDSKDILFQLNSLVKPSTYLKKKTIWGLAILTYILCFFYSVPLIRLKERGFLGPLTIAMSEFALPQMMFFAVFGYLNWITVTSTVLFFVLGLRMILTHQLLDYNKDLEGNVKTFTTIVGTGRVSSLITRFLLPLELGLLILTIFFVNIQIPGTLFYNICCLIGLYFYYILQCKFGNQPLPFLSIVPSAFYFLLLPLFWLTLGLTKSILFFPLLVFHLILSFSQWKFFWKQLWFLWRYLLRIVFMDK